MNTQPVEPLYSTLAEDQEQALEMLNHISGRKEAPKNLLAQLSSRDDPKYWK